MTFLSSASIDPLQTIQHLLRLRNSDMCIRQSMHGILSYINSKIDLCNALQIATSHTVGHCIKLIVLRVDTLFLSPSMTHRSYSIRLKRKRKSFCFYYRVRLTIQFSTHFWNIHLDVIIKFFSYFNPTASKYSIKIFYRMTLILSMSNLTLTN